MATPRVVMRGEPGYPPRLLRLPRPPAELWLTGELTEAKSIAIVGTRQPSSRATAFTVKLARAVASAGAVVVSGGAVGIDSAAHRGALEAGGRTYVVAPTGHRHVFPPENEELFRTVAESAGSMLWPFQPEMEPKLPNYHYRNGVLAALGDVLVIVQAGAPSGTLNAAKWARTLGRAIWVCPGPPWLSKFVGCIAEIDRGARLLTSLGAFMSAVGLSQAGARGPARDPAHGQGTLPLTLARRPPRALSRTGTKDELALLEVLDSTPRHLDEIASRSGLSPPAATTALLTLALENVLVEGPDGFFRRAIAR